MTDTVENPGKPIRFAAAWARAVEQKRPMLLEVLIGADKQPRVIKFFRDGGYSFYAVNEDADAKQFTAKKPRRAPRATAR